MTHPTHSFIYSNTSSFCKECSSISIQYKSTIKPQSFSTPTEMNPLSTLRALINKSTLSKPPSHPLYSKIRPQGITIIKTLATKYDLLENIYHSTIYLLDYLFLHKSHSENIQLTAIVCCILMTKFLGEGSTAMAIQNDMISNGFIKKEVYNMHEMIILKSVGYDLSFATAYDILNAMLRIGIVFSDEEQPTKCLDKMYVGCLLQLNSFVEKKVFVNYTPIEIAFAIVAFTRDIYEFNNESNLRLLCEMFKISMGSYYECFLFFKSKVRVQKCRSNHSNEVNTQQQKSVSVV